MVAHVGVITFFILAISIVTINSPTIVMAAEEDSKITNFKVSQKSVYYGEEFSFSGRLIDGLGYAISKTPIFFWEDDGSSIQDIGTAITDVRGKFKAIITAEYWDGQGNSVEIFAQFPGYGIYKSTRTSIIEINVEKPYASSTFTTPGTITIPESIPEIIEKPQIPDWIRNNAKWWSDGQIGDSDFTSGIQFMIKENIISIPDLPEQTTETTEGVPGWVRNNAGWWADGLISDDDFVSGIKYLVEQGIIKV